MANFMALAQQKIEQESKGKSCVTQNNMKRFKTSRNEELLQNIQGSKNNNKVNEFI